MQFGPLAYQFGLIDELELIQINNDGLRSIQAIQSGKYLEAWAYWDDIINKLANYTGCSNTYYILSCQAEDFYAFTTIFQNSAVRKAVHVGNLSFHTGIS